VAARGIIAPVLGIALAALAFGPALAAGAVHPQKVSAGDVAGKIFERPNTTVTRKKDSTFTDTITLMTRDRKFETGMYRSGPAHLDSRGKDYGVDEFMYFVKGGVTLTSVDGDVQVIHAGEAVTIPHDWRGTFDTKGYTKFYAIYSASGNAD
jgi:uncharacterized cupin superfamily protein